MTFVVTKQKLVWWPVAVPVPKDDGGVQTRTFKARFEILTASRIEELQAEVMAEIERQGRGCDLQVAILREAVKDLADLEDEDKQALSFSLELLDGLLDVPYVRAAMFAAYGDAAAGRKAKN